MQCQHRYKLKPGGDFVCQKLEERQGTAHFGWAARQLCEDNFLCAVYLCWIQTGDSGAGDALELLSTVNAGAAGVTALCGVSCCLLAGQYQKGIGKPANEFKMAFKIGPLAENDLQNANKMTECVM